MASFPSFLSGSRTALVFELFFFLPSLGTSIQWVLCSHLVPPL